MKEAPYKGTVRPVLEYESSVWDPHTNELQDELEKVQNRAVRFVTRNYVCETGSIIGSFGNRNTLRKEERIIDSFCFTMVKVIEKQW